jgi:hypothetical protein
VIHNKFSGGRLRLRWLGGGGGGGADGAGGPEGVDVRLALHAVALVLLQAPPQRLHVARRRRHLLPVTCYSDSGRPGRRLHLVG